MDLQYRGRVIELEGLEVTHITHPFTTEPAAAGGAQISAREEFSVVLPNGSVVRRTYDYDPREAALNYDKIKGDILAIYESMSAEIKTRTGTGA